MHGRSLKLSIQEPILIIKKYLSNRLKNNRLDMDTSGETVEQPKKLKDYLNPSSSIDFFLRPTCI